MSNPEYTKEQLQDIVDQAKAAARVAGVRYLNEVLGGQDQYPCGFAWVELYVKGNTKVGRFLKEIGLRKDSYNRCLVLSHPSGLGVQNMDVALEAAEAAMRVFRDNGFTAYAVSRID